MQTGKFSLKWKDAINAVILSLIANALMIVMNAAEGQFPTLEEFRVGLINTLKYAIIPYLLKNFFTDDVKTAQKTLSVAKAEGQEAAAPIPPVTEKEKVDISKFPPSGTVPVIEHKDI